MVSTGNAGISGRSSFNDSMRIPSSVKELFSNLLSHANPPKRRMSRPGSTDIHNEIRRLRPEPARDRQPPGGRPRWSERAFLVRWEFQRTAETGERNSDSDAPGPVDFPRSHQGRGAKPLPPGNSRTRHPHRHSTSVLVARTVLSWSSTTRLPINVGPITDRPGEAAPRVPRSPASEQPVLGGRVKRLRRLFYTLRSDCKEKGPGIPNFLAFSQGRASSGPPSIPRPVGVGLSHSAFRGVGSCSTTPK